MRILHAYLTAKVYFKMASRPDLKSSKVPQDQAIAKKGGVEAGFGQKNMSSLRAKHAGS